MPTKFTSLFSQVPHIVIANECLYVCVYTNMHTFHSILVGSWATQLDSGIKVAHSCQRMAAIKVPSFVCMFLSLRSFFFL